MWRVVSCMLAAGAISCQTATTSARTDKLRMGAEVNAASITGGTATRAEGIVPGRSSTMTGASTHAAPIVQVPRRLHELTIDSEEFGAIPVLVRVPAHRSDERLPVLFVLHGRGEAMKGPERGVRGFLDDYGLERVWTWLESKTRSPVPDPSITKSQSAVVAQQLEARPFRGMVLVMPYLPDRFRAGEAFEKAKPYASVLRHTAVMLRESFPVADDPRRWALDGISLGGRVSLVCGPMLTDLFGAVGAVQAAIDEREFAALVERMAAPSGQTPPRYFLATSEQDYYRSVLEAFHEHLTQQQLSHSFTILPGDHSYSFNRGPGLTYLLLTYDAFLNP